MKSAKRLLAILLILALLPVIPAKAASPEADYAAADAIFAQIDRLLAIPTRSAGLDGVYELVSGAEGVEPGSLSWQGPDRLTWRTRDGVTCACAYAPEEMANRAPRQKDLAEDLPGTGEICLFQPFYGLDADFEEDYWDTAALLARRVGDGSFRHYTGTDATIDALAAGVAEGGVVIVDSHGSTVYTNASDRVGSATHSYILLSTAEGLTTRDYDDGHASYTHFIGLGRVWEVDGTVVADHMPQDSQNGLFWNACCYGMTTDTICRPLLEKGVGAVYGYTNAVTFGGDQLYQREFFRVLAAGGTVAQAFSAMTDRWGLWDYTPAICREFGWDDGYICADLEEAWQKKAAFPVLVSAGDPYPGNAARPQPQQVNCGWRLLSTGQYRDVDPEGWYFAGVEFCARRGYMTGAQPDRFDLNSTISRGQLVTVLYRIAGEPEWAGESPFTDVDPEKYYAPGVAWAAGVGVVTGTGPAEFQPDGAVTRQQLVTILYRFAREMGYDIWKTGPDPDFPDRDALAPYARQPFRWALQNGLIQGVQKRGVTLLDPRGTATRAQVAVVLMRLLG